MKHCKNCQNVIGPWPLLRALALNEKKGKGLACPSCGKIVTKPLHHYLITWAIFLILPIVAWIDWLWFEEESVLRFLGMLLGGLVIYVALLYWILPFEARDDSDTRKQV